MAKSTDEIGRVYSFAILGTILPFSRFSPFYLGIWCHAMRWRFKPMQNVERKLRLAGYRECKALTTRMACMYTLRMSYMWALFFAVYVRPQLQLRQTPGYDGKLSTEIERESQTQPLWSYIANKQQQTTFPATGTVKTSQTTTNVLKKMKQLKWARTNEATLSMVACSLQPGAGHCPRKHGSSYDRSGVPLTEKKPRIGEVGSVWRWKNRIIWTYLNTCRNLAVN